MGGKNKNKNKNKTPRLNKQNTNRPSTAGTDSKDGSFIESGQAVESQGEPFSTISSTAKEGGDDVKVSAKSNFQMEFCRVIIINRT